MAKPSSKHVDDGVTVSDDVGKMIGASTLRGIMGLQVEKYR